MLALAFVPVAVGWGLYEIFTPEDDDNGNESSSKTATVSLQTEGPIILMVALNDTLSGLVRDTIVGGYGNTSLMAVLEAIVWMVAQAMTSYGWRKQRLHFRGFVTIPRMGITVTIPSLVNYEDLIDAGREAISFDGGNNDIIGGFSEADILKGADGNDTGVSNNGDMI